MFLKDGYVSPSPQHQPKIVSAAIYCGQSFSTLNEKIRKRYKGNFLREAQKASHKYSIATFKPSDLADRIEEINKSLPVRCGGAMRPAYYRSADELRFAYRNEPWCGCRNHWSVWWGVFASDDADGLVGYVQLKRYGELASYSTILGHGARMGDGIMPILHLSIMNKVLWVNSKPWVDKLGDELNGYADFDGIKWLMYAGWHDGIGKGLNLWKRKAGFDPVMFFNK